MGFPISIRNEVVLSLIAFANDNISMIPGCQPPSRSPVVVLDMRAVYFSPQNPHLSALAKLSTRKKTILPLYFSRDYLRAPGCAQLGDRHNRVIRSRTAANRSLDTATSAIWKIICRAWRTIRPPILISFTWRLRNDQSFIVFGKHSLRRKLPRL